MKSGFFLVAHIITAAPNIAIFTASPLLLALCPFSHSAIRQISRAFVKIGDYPVFFSITLVAYAVRFSGGFDGHCIPKLSSIALRAADSALVPVPDFS